MRLKVKEKENLIIKITISNFFVFLDKYANKKDFSPFMKFYGN